MRAVVVAFGFLIVLMGGSYVLGQQNANVGSDPAGAQILAVILVLYLIAGIWWWWSGAKQRKLLVREQEEMLRNIRKMVANAAETGDYSKLQQWSGVTVDQAEVDDLAEQFRHESRAPMSQKEATIAAIGQVVMRDMPDDIANLPTTGSLD